jgi:hypothetical protein
MTRIAPCARSTNRVRPCAAPCARIAATCTSGSGERSGSRWHVTVHFYGECATRFFPFFVLPGVIASTAIGIYQSRQIRAPIDKRFLAALACLLAFGALWPFVLGLGDSPSANIRIFAFFALLVMQLYVLAGIWFDNFLLALGLGVSALILTGLFAFPEIFWLWFAVCCGGPVVLSGFIVRFWWR